LWGDMRYMNMRTLGDARSTVKTWSLHQELIVLRQCAHFPAILQVIQSVHKPSCKPCTALKEFVQTVQTVHKPSYKPCATPKEYVQTVQTVHNGVYLFQTPNRNGLYGLYTFLKCRARFVGRFVDGLYGLYEFLKCRARFVGRFVDGMYGL